MLLKLLNLFRQLQHKSHLLGKMAVLTFCCLFSSSAIAQVFCQKVEPATVAINSSAGIVLRPASGAKLWACPAGSAGTAPCAPLSNLFTPTGAAVTNPMTADTNGNFGQMCVSTPGRYMLQVGGAGLTTNVVDGIIFPGDPISPTFTNLTVNGTATFKGNLNICSGCLLLFGDTPDTGISRNVTTPGTFMFGNSGFNNTSGIIQTNAFNAGNGTGALPSFSFLNNLDMGMYRLSNNNLAFSASAAGRLQLNSSGVFLPAGEVMAWASGTIGSAQDFGISRDAAGVGDVGSGTATDKSGRLNMTTLGINKNDGTVPATITNDASGGINLTPNAGVGWSLVNDGRLFSGVGKTLVLQGSSSGSVTVAVPAAAGSNTATFPAATGNIVLDSATQSLSGKTYNGTTLHIQTFTGSGTQTLAAGVTSEECTIIGGGGGGGGGNAGGDAGGGGSGGVAVKTLSGLTPGNTITITVGGTANGGAASNPGTAGNASSISSGTQSITTVTAQGGSPGGGGGAGTTGFGGAGAAISTNGDLNGGGNPGQAGTTTQWGGGSGGSPLLGGGQGSNGGTTGLNGLANTGAGGSGGHGANAGGNGAAGQIYCKWVN